MIHGASHADVAQTPLFFDVVGLEHGARMRKQSFFEATEKDQRKLQALGRVQAHERNLRALVVVVGIADKSGVVEKLVKRFSAVARVHRGIHQLTQVFDAGERFRRVLLFEQLDVAGAVDQKLEQVGGGGKDGGPAAGTSASQ